MTDLPDYPETPERTADRERLQEITDVFDAAGPEALTRSVLHPHAVLDTAWRRAQEAGLGDNESEVLAAVMGMWTDGFMAGQRAMANLMNVDLDRAPERDVQG